MNDKTQNDIRAFDVTGIGNACIDIVANCDYDFLPRHKVYKSHCIYVSRSELELLKSELDSYELIPGGSAANMIYCLQSLGGRGAFLGKISDDNEGRTFEKSMTDIGVSTYLKVENHGEGSTQLASLRTPDGDRSFVTYRGVAETISPSDIDYKIIEQSKIVFFDGYTMYSPQAFSLFMQAAETAAANNNLSVLNPGDLSIVENHKAEVLQLLEKVDIVICNLAEASEMLGTSSLQKAAEKLASTKKAGAITNGAHGAALFKDGEILYMKPPEHGIKEIYTLGAGDHFAAGFLYGYIHGYTLPQMARLSELCALDCLSHAGARPLGSLEHLVAQSFN